MSSFDKRVRVIETGIGAALPQEYVAFLRKSPPRLGAVGVPFRDEVWNLTDFLELSEGQSYIQLDATYQLVSAFFPPHALPIACDHAGNFFCMYLAGPFSGQVHWWDHERDVEDISTEIVARSFSAFLASICPLRDDV